MTKTQRWTPARQRRFLKALAQTANVSASAAAAGLSRSAVYRQRAGDAAFAEAWDEALNTALDALEEALMKRAIQGVDKPVFYGGKPCGSTRTYSDALAMFLLKSRRPEVYGEVAAARRAVRDGASADGDSV
ncbi:MAG: hypothetical protein D6782_01170, partial [Alphaproteobacteria bacterium]